MRIKDDFQLEGLIKYGFTKVDPEDYDEYSPILSYEWLFEIGHGRRGQYYYLLVSSTRSVSLYASEPDGSGAPTCFPDVVFTMFADGILHEDK